MNSITLLPMPNPGIEILADALKQKADALALAKTITGVSSRIEQSDAIACASLVKGLVKAMESSRVDVKKPVLEIGRKIDAIAAGYSKELSAELLRIESLASDFQRKEDANAAALRRQEEERQRKEREMEQADKEREHRFLEDKEGANIEERRADLARIANATTDEEREEARRIADQNAEARAEEYRNIQAAIREEDEKRLDRERERAMTLHTVVQPVKAAGASVRRSYDFTLLDVHALYRGRPDLVTLEPKRAMVLAAIANGQSIPGISVFEATKVHAK